MGVPHDAQNLASGWLAAEQFVHLSGCASARDGCRTSHSIARHCCWCGRTAYSAADDPADRGTAPVAPCCTDSFAATYVKRKRRIHL